MKFRSILSFRPDLRSNVISFLFIGVFLSLQSLISSVRIQPNDDIKAIWNTDTLFVTCAKDNLQTPGTLKWFSQMEEIDDNSKAPVYVQHSGSIVRLFLVNVPKKHAGIFECRHILDGMVQSSAKFKLKVYSSVNMDRNKDSHIGIEGHTYSMPCIAKFDSDSSQATISWTRNNLPIKDRQGQFAIANTVTQSVTQKNVRSILTIKHLTKENEGTYTCEAVYANSFMTDLKTIDITFRVQFKPRFTKNISKNVWICDTTEPIVVNFTCVVYADPVAEFQWLTGDGVPIENGRIPVKHTIHSTENLSVLSLEYNDFKQIRNIFRDPDGTYRKFECKARNVIGEAKMTFELHIGQLPHTPLLDKYHYENGVLVLSVIETEVGPPIDLYRVEIDRNHQIYFNASNQNNTYKIAVDLPSGTHEFRIFAHNPVGWSESIQLVINSGSDPQLYWALLLMSSVLMAVTAL